MNIDELKKIISDMKKDNAFNMALDLLSKCVTIIDAQAEQIAILKAALIEERAYVIECNPNRTWEWTHAQAKDRAREQFAHKLPQFNWEDV